MAVLQDPKDFALQAQRHVADFVEEKGAAVALLEAADALGCRAGEGAFFVAEKLALEKLLRNGRAVDCEKALRTSLTVMMNRAGDEFFARAASPEIITGASECETRPIILKTC